MTFLASTTSPRDGTKFFVSFRASWCVQSASWCVQSNVSDDDRIFELEPTHLARHLGYFVREGLAWLARKLSTHSVGKRQLR